MLENRYDVVLGVDERYPELLGAARSTGSEALRGAFVDQVAHTLNKLDNTQRWGRKARIDGDASSLNDDVLTYRNPNGSFRMIDIVQGDLFLPGWDLRPAEEQNGYWHPPLNPDLDRGQPVPQPPVPPVPPVPGTPGNPQEQLALLLKQALAGIASLEALGESIEDLLIQLNSNLENMPTYEGRFLGVKIKLEPKYSD